MYLKITYLVIFNYILNMAKDGKGVEVFNSSDRHKLTVAVWPSIFHPSSTKWNENSVTSYTLVDLVLRKWLGPFQVNI